MTRTRLAVLLACLAVPSLIACASLSVSDEHGDLSGEGGFEEFPEHVRVFSDTNNTGIEDSYETPPNNIFTYAPSARRQLARPYAAAYPRPLPRDSSLHLVISNRADTSAVCAHIELPDGSLLACSTVTLDRYRSGTLTFPPIRNTDADSIIVRIYTLAGTLSATLTRR